MNGLHLTADLRDCAQPLPPAMTDPRMLRELCLAVLGRAGLHAVGELFHRFDLSPAPPQGAVMPQGGVTGMVLLAESHLAVHTWPEIHAVTLDIYVCNLGADNSHRAHQALNELIAAFAPRQVQRQTLRRGQSLALPLPEGAAL